MMMMMITILFGPFTIVVRLLFVRLLYIRKWLPFWLSVLFCSCVCRCQNETKKHCSHSYCRQHQLCVFKCVFFHSFILFICLFVKTFIHSLALFSRIFIIKKTRQKNNIKHNLIMIKNSVKILSNVYFHCILLHTSTQFCF